MPTKPILPPKHLADMRAVYSNPDVAADTPEQIPLRVWKTEDLPGFVRALNQYEKEFAAEARSIRKARQAARGTGAKRVRTLADADGGTKAALELVEKMLKEVK